MIDRIPEMPDYKTGFLFSTIMVIGKETMEEPDFDEEVNFGLLMLEYEEDHIWLEGIDYLIPLPKNISKELFDFKYQS